MAIGWTRKDLFDVAQAYADRYDAEVENMLIGMLGLAEDRMSRIMRNHDMTAELVMALTGVHNYDLPSDFGGFRTIYTENNTPLMYVNPEQYINLHDVNEGAYFTILAQKLRIVPAIDNTNLYLTYYQRVPPLANDQDTNWVLTDHADIYKTAMMAEIEEFVKNDERSVHYWNKLDAMFAEIKGRDWHDRWSGNSLTIRLEDGSNGPRVD